MYYLTIKAKRRNGKRHIKDKSIDVNVLKDNARFIDRDRYIVQIYNGKWELLETL